MLITEFQIRRGKSSLIMELKQLLEEFSVRAEHCWDFCAAALLILIEKHG